MRLSAWMGGWPGGSAESVHGSNVGEALLLPIILSNGKFFGLQKWIHGGQMCLELDFVQDG